MRPNIDWSFIVSARVLDALAQGLKVTLTVVLVAGLLAILIGSAVALLQVSSHRAAQRAGRIYVALFRNIPLLILLFFFYFGLPTLLPRSHYPLVYSDHYEIQIAIIAVTLVSAAFIAEVIRGGIETIVVGQLESALATGLSRRQGLQYVVLPQLGPTVLPGLSNEAINIVKNSSFAMTIGVTELIWQAQQIEADTFRGFEAMTAVTLVFLLLNGTIFVTFRVLEYALRAK
jgi:His/Glu/Gln/Arg/opine family amino acid ABC transporter permease subunit